MTKRGTAAPAQATTNDTSDVGEEDVLRARFYALLNQLLAAPLSPEGLQNLQSLEGDDSDMGRALAQLGENARTVDGDDVADEYTRLFYGHGAGGELTPYASFYLTGFVYEKPLSDLRTDLAGLGIGKGEGDSEPEDHIGFLCEVMHALILGCLGSRTDVAGQQRFFENHMAPWATRFFEDMESAENADFYKPVGTIGRLLMEIEAQAFDMAA